MNLSRALRTLPGRFRAGPEPVPAGEDKDESEGDRESSFASGYEEKRPREHFARYHELARERRPTPVYEATRALTMPLALGAWRLRPIDLHNVPEVGPAILAPNHFSILDHFFAGMMLRRKLVYMAKSQLFTFPLDVWLRHMRSFPVRRGRRDEDAFTTAHAILARGDLLLMYAEGGRSGGATLGSPRPGVGRLALESGAPVVPVAIVGSQRVGEWRHGRFPRVTVRYGAPISFERVESPERSQSLAASTEIFDRVRAMHGELSAE